VTEVSIITGYRRPLTNRVDLANSKSTGPVVSSQAMANTGDGAYGVPADAAQAVSVNITVTVAANADGVREAAERLAISLLELKDILQGYTADTKVVFSSGSTTVGNILQDMNNTRFTVTDETGFGGNNGVGAAIRGTPNTETINYHSILNEPQSYGDKSLYPGNTGIYGIMLHELGHISALGEGFRSYSVNLQRQDPTTKTSTFYQTDYSKNLELFANNFMDAAATALRINLYNLAPGGYRGTAKAPSDIYNSHVPPNQQI